MDLKTRMKFAPNAFKAPDGTTTFNLDLPEEFFTRFPSSEQRLEALEAISKHAATLGFDDNTPIAFWLPEHLRYSGPRVGGTASGAILPVAGMVGASTTPTGEAESDICVTCTGSRRKVLRIGFTGAIVAVLAMFSPFRQRQAGAVDCSYCGYCNCGYCASHGFYVDYYKCTVGAPGRNCGYCRNYCYTTKGGSC